MLGVHNRGEPQCRLAGPCITESETAGDRLHVVRLARLVPEVAVLSLLVLVVAAVFPPVPAHAQAKEVASYQIRVTLDPDAKQLTGSERIAFLNDTSRPIDELYFHLYPNAFSGPNTTFMRENPSAAQQAAAREAAAVNAWGGMTVSALRLASGVDLLPRSTVDETVMMVPLPEPLEPGESIQLDVEFSVKLPRLIARMGYQGDTFTIAQWFPKLAALTEKGWVAHQGEAGLVRIRVDGCLAWCPLGAVPRCVLTLGQRVLASSW